ncbi:MAG: hypothetical protein ACI4TW_03020 [Prevotella sp.]
MKKYKCFAGFFLMIAGVIVLLSCVLPHYGTVNVRLVVGGICVVAGVLLQIRIMKDGSPY